MLFDETILHYKILKKLGESGPAHHSPRTKSEVDNDW
jgi:hypothetical protein